MERAFSPLPYWLNDSKPSAPPTSSLLDYSEHQNLGVQMHPSMYIMSVNSAMPANFVECFLDIA